MLRLHKRYSIPATLEITKKLTQQYVGPFQIDSKVERLAYRLKIPRDWKIHPFFSVAQLEPVPPPTKDPLFHSYPTHPLPVFVDGDKDSVKSFEVERLLNKRTNRQGRGNSVEYLVR